MMVGLAGLALAAACKKPVPNEVVYTGSGTPGGGAIGAVDAGPIVAVDAGAPDGTFTKARFLKAMAQCAGARVDAFATGASSLEAALASEAGVDAGANPDARAAWQTAFAALQALEVFAVGPYAYAPAPGAQGLRDEIYAWPLVSRCRIEEQLVAKDYEAATFPATLVNARGMAAIEFLLFSAETTNACSSFSVINASGSWAALSAGELAQRRRAYALAAARDVSTRAEALRDAWAVDRGNFQGALASAGRGSSVYGTEAAGLNALTDALIYLDETVKDWKLGKPAGFFECATGTCPAAVEAPFAKASTLAIAANLDAARQVVQGCGRDGSGLGVDDWLASIGAPELANRLVGALVAASQAVAAIDGPVDEVLARDASKVARAHANVKALTALWKDEVLPALTMQLPTSAQGDND
jgi:predicted lipoprotein